MMIRESPEKKTFNYFGIFIVVYADRIHHIVPS
jgi:hypothetical protein